MLGLYLLNVWYQILWDRLYAEMLCKRCMCVFAGHYGWYYLCLLKPFLVTRDDFLIFRLGLLGYYGWSFYLLFRAWEGDTDEFLILFTLRSRKCSARGVCVCVCVSGFCAVDWGVFFVQSIGMYFCSSLAAPGNALQEVWCEMLCKRCVIWEGGNLRLYFLLLHSMRLQAN